jgi:hypothetical protein
MAEVSEKKMSPEIHCESCLDTWELDDGRSCPECCPHDDRDCGHCIECGKDVFEGSAYLPRGGPEAGY